MSFAFASRRGALLNCRLAVNGIQNASRSSDAADEPETPGVGAAAGLGSLCIRGLLRPARLGMKAGETASLEASSCKVPEPRAFASENRNFASREARVLQR